MRRLVALFITAFVDTVGMAMIIPLLPYYATDFGAGAAMVGVLIAAHTITQLASAPFWGRLSDRHGRRPVIAIGLLLAAVAYAIFAAAETVTMLLISRVVQGLGAGTIGVVQAYAADASAPEQRTRTLGWLSAVTSGALVVGPALGSLTIALGGRAAPGITAAVLAALFSGFAWQFLREAGERSSPTPEQPISEAGVLWRILSRPRDPASRLILTYAIGIGAFYGTAPTMPLLFDERFGITERTVGYLVMYFGAVGVLVRMLVLGRLVDRLGEPTVSRLGIVALAAGLGTLAASHSLPVLFVSLTVMPLGTALLFPSLTGLLSRLVAPHERGLYLGVQQSYGGASRIAFPLATGLAMDELGYGTAFWVAALLVLATLGLDSRLTPAR